MQEDNQRLGEVTVTAQKPLVKAEIDKLTYSLEDDPRGTDQQYVGYVAQSADGNRGWR